MSRYIYSVPQQLAEGAHQNAASYCCTISLFTVNSKLPPVQVQLASKLQALNASGISSLEHAFDDAKPVQIVPCLISVKPCTGQATHVSYYYFHKQQLAAHHMRLLAPPVAAGTQPGKVWHILPQHSTARYMIVSSRRQHCPFRSGLLNCSQCCSSGPRLRMTSVLKALQHDDGNGRLCTSKI
jgi:hypothetical protein